MNRLLKTLTFSLLILGVQFTEASQSNDGWIAKLPSGNLDFVQTLDTPNYQQWENTEECVTITKHDDLITKSTIYAAYKYGVNTYVMEIFFKNGSSNLLYKDQEDQREYFLAPLLADCVRKRFKKCDDTYKGIIEIS